MAETNGLLNRRTGKLVPGVRIPPSPHNKSILRLAGGFLFLARSKHRQTLSPLLCKIFTHNLVTLEIWLKTRIPETQSVRGWICYDDLPIGDHASNPQFNQVQASVYKII